MDALHEELRRNRNDGGLNVNTAAYKIMANTQLIYMMANQLALLDLTQLDHYPFQLNSVSRSRERCGLCEGRGRAIDETVFGRLVTS